MVEKGFNQEKFAKELKMNKSTLSRKLRRGDFLICEANKIVEVLELTADEAVQIFFAKSVA